MSDQQTPSVPDISTRADASEPSRVIRTYAQDLAAMQGTANPEEVAKQLKALPKRKGSAVPVPTAVPTLPKPKATTSTPEASANVSKTSPKKEPPTPAQKTHPGIPLGLVVTRNTPPQHKEGMIARFFSELVGSSRKKSTLPTKAPGPMAGSSLIPDMTPVKMPVSVPAQKSDIAAAPIASAPEPTPLPTPSVTTAAAASVQVQSEPKERVAVISKNPTPVSPTTAPVQPAPLPTPAVVTPAPAQPVQKPVATEPAAFTTAQVTQKEVASPEPTTEPAEVFAPMPVAPTPTSTYTPEQPVHAMVMPQAPPSLSTPAQAVPPQDISPIPLRTPAAVGAPAESREQLLARLHAQAAAHGEPNERLIEDSVLPQAQTTAPELVPINNPTPTAPATKLSPLHTYKSDFSEHVNDTNASGIEILAAQQDAVRREPVVAAPVHNPYAVWFAVGGVIFLVASMAGLLYAYRYNTHLSAPVATRTTAPTLIFVDGQKELSGTGVTLQKALAHAATQSLAKGSMRLTYISVATTTLMGATTTVPGAGGYLIAALGLPIPDILMRNISLESTVGVIHAGTQEAPFFVMRIASYDAAFAGMLRWERTMKRDFALLYPSYPALPQVSTTLSTTTATSTLSVASSSQPITPVFTKAPTFVDKVIVNHDVRVLYDSAGRSLLLYGFWNKHTIIIARNSAAFIEIINRLNNSNTQ